MRNLVIKQIMYNKNATNYTFLKSPWPANSKGNTFAKFLKPKCVIQENLKMCKFPFKASVQISVQNFSAKIVKSGWFCYRLAKVS